MFHFQVWSEPEGGTYVYVPKHVIIKSKLNLLKTVSCLKEYNKCYL
jgi:hypothetical protein